MPAPEVRAGDALSNPSEAAIIAGVVRALDQGRVPLCDIGIISPFRAQVSTHASTIKVFKKNRKKTTKKDFKNNELALDVQFCLLESRGGEVARLMQESCVRGKQFMQCLVALEGLTSFVCVCCSMLSMHHASCSHLQYHKCVILCSAVLLAGAAVVKDLQGKVLVTGRSAYSGQVPRQG